MDELVIASNPDPDSRLPYVIRVPYGNGLVFRAGDTWPRTKAVYCYPLAEWPAGAEVLERVPVKSCERRGAAVDLVLDRARENRSQLVFTTARGRDAVFWQGPRTRKQARPGVRTPTARAAGISELEIIVDSHERYGYRFAGQQANVVRRALKAGDYGIEHGGRLIASVERKSLADLVSSLTSGRLKYALGELAALPRAAIVVEDRYSQVFKLERVRPAVVADGLAELQIHFPGVPIVFCETRQLAEEWTYRYLAAAYARELDHADTADRTTAAEPAASLAGIRAWARGRGLAVADRGRIAADVVAAYHEAHPAPAANLDS
ncbi:Lsr2 protein [Kribbella sp. VKM Ac-2527]|uniref:Lsr2 protein n=1 Tax=Kribbella caucasensis TaxID=2512215 RepID=A0A4R6K8T8_9ACTN|nr:histone-like nucleoid-structuring protein Lsr2 [Kribbella sp. VKM Ac-2527]TDO44376.1 Lsr2 protein [Kribbella sp. VKM Ac-2527]